jgi:tripartite-type tricarboxylate transporter receptor subunit TctC
VQAVFSTTPPAIEHIRAGKLRALAVTSAMRSEALPELTIIGDFLPGYEATFMVGLGGPKNVPAELVDRLNREINAALTDPAIKARLADLGTVPLPMASTDFGAQARETARSGDEQRQGNPRPRRQALRSDVRRRFRRARGDASRRTCLYSLLGPH